MEREWPSVEPEPNSRIEFQEYQGLFTDMFGYRAWMAWHENKEYVVWEIPRNDMPPHIATRIEHGGHCYRLNWRPNNPERTYREVEPYMGVADCLSFDEAVAEAHKHAGIQVEPG